MNKSYYLLAGILLFGINLSLKSQINDDGAISIEMLKEIKTYYDDSETTKALTNAVTANDISKLALNWENTGKIDSYFSHKVKVKGITDQKSTGQCWLYTGLNVIRPVVIEKQNLKEFYFSQDFSFFWDQLEKANLFLEGVIQTKERGMDDKLVEWLFKHPIADGGVWSGFVGVVKKYGAIPYDVMPDTYSGANTRIMSRFIRRKLKEDGLKLREMYSNGHTDIELRNIKTKMLGEVYRMLAISLGEPPEEFTWRFEDRDGKVTEPRTYTPVEFYNEVVGIDLDDYILFMDDPTKEYGKLYEIEFDRNVFESMNWQFINLQADDFKPFAVKSIIDNEAMYFSCDVGKQLNKEKGILDVNNFDYSNLFGVDFDMDKSQRIITFESGSTHGMALVAVDLDINGNIKKWLLENSWGEKSGYKGYLIMTDAWFDEYMFRLVINKKYVNDEILKIMEQEPVLLPPWDPMFAAEE